MIKVVIADESSASRYLIKKTLEKDNEIIVIGEAKTGKETIKLVSQLQPDVIALDIKMSNIDGIKVTEQIMQETPLPIVGLSNNTTDNFDERLKIIKAGALTVLKKPQDSGCNIIDDQQQEFINSLKILSEVKVVRMWTGKRLGNIKKINKNIQRKHSPEIIGIATSTGGPDALAKILKQLPENFSVPILIVQHIMKGFTNNFVTWLNNFTGLNIKLAEQHEQIRNNMIYVAPDDFHMSAHHQRILLSKEQPIKGHRPSANYLFNSIAKYYSQKGMGVILTGMGDDGASGIKAIKDSGGTTIAQDEKSSVIFGMPKEAINLNAIDRIVSIDQIGKVILNYAQPNSRKVINTLERKNEKHINS